MKTQKKKQVTKFKELAKELGCDDDEKAFKDKLKKVVQSKEKPEK
ncbi:MAG: hypothetical protein OEY94_07925 [Alphaproteobacteria bacterium]|nr:hypothetical protein [Alphaproteobacteria bacterium]